jgi:hypothetical protein
MNRPNLAKLPPLEALAEGMLLTTLRVTRWRGKQKLDYQADLGLMDVVIDANDPTYGHYADQLRQTISGGQRKLLPPDMEQRLKKIEKTARNVVEDLAFRTSGSVLGTLLPKGNYEKLKERLFTQPYDPEAPERGSLRDDYFAMRDLIVAERNAIEDHIRKSYRNLGVMAWRLQASLPMDSPQEPPEGWLRAYLNRIINSLPSERQIYDSFEFDLIVQPIDLPTNMDRKIEQLEQQKQMLEGAVERLKAQTSEGNDKYNEQIRQQQETLNSLNQEIRLQRELADRNNQRQNRQAQPALAEVLATVPSLLAAGVANALEAVRANGKMPPQTTGGLKRLAQKAKDLNWLKDETLDARIASLHTLIDQYAGYSVGAQAEQALSTLLEELNSDLAGLGIAPRQPRERVEVPVEPAETGKQRQGRSRPVEAEKESLPEQKIEQAQEKPVAKRQGRKRGILAEIAENS